MVNGLALAFAISTGLCVAAPQQAETLFPPEWEGVQVVIQDVPIKAVLRVSERVQLREMHIGMYFRARLDANGDQIRVTIEGCYNADGSVISVGDGGPVFVFSWDHFMDGYGAMLPLPESEFFATFTLFSFHKDETGPYAIWREGVIKLTCDGGAAWEVSDQHPYIEFELRPVGSIYDRDDEAGAALEG